jgi:hypothetical protein
VIHAACDFSTEMVAIEHHLLDLLLTSLAAHEKVAFAPCRQVLVVRRDR